MELIVLLFNFDAKKTKTSAELQQMFVKIQLNSVFSNTTL